MIGGAVSNEILFFVDPIAPSRLQHRPRQVGGGLVSKRPVAECDVGVHHVRSVLARRVRVEKRAADDLVAPSRVVPGRLVVVQELSLPC